MKVADMVGGLPIGTSPLQRWRCWFVKHIPSTYEYGHRYPSMFCWRCGKELDDGPQRNWGWMDFRRNWRALSYKPRRIESRETMRYMRKHPEYNAEEG